MQLLQAHVSLPAPEPKKDSKEIALVDPNSEVKIVEDTALLPNTGPTGVSDGTETDIYDEDQTMDVYVVRSGDTASSVAKMFDVTADTIWSVNGMKSGSKLTVGDVLLILPFPGIEYTVQKGDTLQGIANKYKVDVADILAANVDVDAKLVVGESFIIPGANLIKETKPTPKSGGKIPSSPTSSKYASGYFIKPIPCGLTQGKHDGHAVDMSCGHSGTPIHAAASGIVKFAKIGWNGAFGNLTIIEHPNGTQTYYAHQSEIDVSAGEHVTQGQVIGKVGSTGRSTGPHLHFEVRGASNPGWNNSWVTPGQSKGDSN